MTRGKHADAAARRRSIAESEVIQELTSELTDVRSRLMVAERQAAHADALAARLAEVERHLADDTDPRLAAEKDRHEQEEARLRAVLLRAGKYLTEFFRDGQFLSLNSQSETLDPEWICDWSFMDDYELRDLTGFIVTIPAMNRRYRRAQQNRRTAERTKAVALEGLRPRDMSRNQREAVQNPTIPVFRPLAETARSQTHERVVGDGAA